MRQAHPAARTVVGKGETGESRRREAVASASSADGNWVYTLYDGADDAPFVHALSTVDRITVCIDLDALEHRRDVASMALKLNEPTHTLKITSAGIPVAAIDTKTFEPRTPPAAPAQAVAP